MDQPWSLSPGLQLLGSLVVACGVHVQHRCPAGVHCLSSSNGLRPSHIHGGAVWLHLSVFVPGVISCSLQQSADEIAVTSFPVSTLNCMIWWVVQSYVCSTRGWFQINGCYLNLHWLCPENKAICVRVHWCETTTPMLTPAPGLGPSSHIYGKQLLLLGIELLSVAVTFHTLCQLSNACFPTFHMHLVPTHSSKQLSYAPMYYIELKI